MHFNSLKRRLGTSYLQEMSFDSWKEKKKVMKNYCICFVLSVSIYCQNVDRILVLDVQSCVLPLMGILSAQDLQMSGYFNLVASRAENFGLCQ